MKILALDVGSKRIGVAMANTDIGIAMPRAYIAGGTRALAAVASLVRSEEIARVLVGYPLTLGGNESAQTRTILKWVERLRAEIAVPVEMADERWTTVLATRAVRERAGRGEQGKGAVDSEAARILLVSWLEKNV